jgi:hypothetical protein
MHPAVQRRKRKCPKRPQQEATPFDQGWHYGALRWRALERGESPIVRACPFQPGTRAEAEYVRGWRAAVRKFASESIDNCHNP